MGQTVTLPISTATDDGGVSPEDGTSIVGASNGETMVKTKGKTSSGKGSARVSKSVSITGRRNSFDGLN